jgi:flagellar basal-body rod protein FlgC
MAKRSARKKNLKKTIYFSLLRIILYVWDNNPPIKGGTIMDISFSAPVSAMNAAQLRLDNTAHNVANVNTENFRPQRVEQAETTRQAQQPAQPARDTFEATAAGANAGTAAYNAGTTEPDLARDMTDMVAERNTYSANAAAIRAQDEVTGTTIDLVA